MMTAKLLLWFSFAAMALGVLACLLLLTVLADNGIARWRRRRREAVQLAMDPMRRLNR